MEKIWVYNAAGEEAEGAVPERATDEEEAREQKAQEVHEQMQTYDRRVH